MNKNNFICLVLLFSSFISFINGFIYRPFFKKKHDFDGELSKNEIDYDDVCSYYHKRDTHGDTGSEDILYVKGCKKGKICRSSGYDINIETCQENQKLHLLVLGESCTFDSQCDSGLTCVDGKCSFANSDPGYIPYNKGGYKFCLEGHSPIFNGSTTHFTSIPDPESYRCYKSSDFKTNYYYYFEKGDTNKYIYKSPDFLKVPGKIEFGEETRDNTVDGKKYDFTYYYVQSIEEASIGSVEDGEYVADERACKSGFGIEYYAGKQLDIKSYDNQNTQKFKRCISVKEVDISVSGKCIIKYDLDEFENIIDASSRISTPCEDIKIKLELFEKFTDKMSDCESKPYEEEPYTCGKEKLRKYYFFYNNPTLYRYYKDEEQIVNYLILTNYNSNSILMVNTILLLLLFFYN